MTEDERIAEEVSLAMKDHVACEECWKDFPPDQMFAWPMGADLDKTDKRWCGCLPF